MSEKLQRFTDLMKQIFELDKSDLDFGIYRIMNIRKAEIEKFLTEGLPKKVRDTLVPFAQGNSEEIKDRMSQIEQMLGDLSLIPDAVPMKAEYLKLQKQLAEGTDLAALETDVYSALYSFFSRYYEEGDFISKRRYKEGVYAIPYEGEEVKLYWANQDQYYIKTSENFKDYTFLVGDYTVHFRLVDATTEQNNNKEQADSKRTFMLFTEDEENYPGIRTFEYNDDTKEFIIRFIFDIPEDKKKKYLEANYDAIRSYIFNQNLPMWQDLLAPIPTGKGSETTDLLRKHLTGYVAKNTFDYFIHKDLRGFLNRELDFYIKNEIMHLDDLDTGNEARVETYLAKVKAVKRVGKIIIDFLAQIEDFQKKLWLKKKFVVETNWCMTLDKVDESFWPEIIGNAAQIAEWIAMYAIDEAGGWTNPPSLDFLRQNQNLLIDTKHFTEDFKERLVARTDVIDNNTNILMINADNFHALSVIKERFCGLVDAVYIDPPYNTNSSAIMYKNGYKNSSWISMMTDRLISARELMSDKGIIGVAIDDVEERYLHSLLDEVFSYSELGNIAIRSNPSGRPMNTGLAIAHDYTLFYSKDRMNSLHSLDRPAEWDTRYKERDSAGIFMWELLRKRGTNSARADRPKLYYPIYYNGKSFRVPQMKWDENERVWKILEQAFPDEIVCWPIDENGMERNWRWSADKIAINTDALQYRENGKIPTVYYKYRPPQNMTVTSMWIDSKYSATEHGSNLLKSYFKEYSPFSFPKSLYAVKDCLRVSINSKEGYILDFFAGSGTTGHATVELNREDNGNRKAILVEMGEYFDTVTLPRMKKVVYSTDWKDGKPQNRNTGVSQIIKYMRLESYEDALSNIELKDDSKMISLFGEEYLIQYMLDLDSRDSLLNVAAFTDPFAYKMKITEKNECKERPVDLIETFNYLIGLTVAHQGAVAYFSAFPASEPAYEGAVELRKDLGGQYAFRQIEGTLPDGRRALVIWRTVTDNVLESNAALDAYFTKYRINPADREYDVIYVNGDNNLENLRTANETWKVQMTEIEFKKRMFEEAQR